MSVHLRKAVDRLSARGVQLVLVGVLLFAAGLIGILVFRSLPLLRESSFSGLFLSAAWRPWKGHFGFASFVVASMAVTLIALLLASPISILGALFLSEHSSRRSRWWIRLPIDILAGVPSVVFGLVGVFAVVPAVAHLAIVFGIETTGYSLLAGGILLALMVIPFIFSLSLDVLCAVPAEAREAALALGATRWETARHVVLKRSRAGLGAAVVLGFTRAFGETIAVMMVVGNVAKLPHSLFDPAYPLPALIANNFGELMTIPHFDAALFLAALVLMVVVGLFTLAAHVMLRRLGRV
jgi:phosphate transport system permease protein